MADNYLGDVTALYPLDANSGFLDYSRCGKSLLANGSPVTQATNAPYYGSWLRLDGADDILYPAKLHPWLIGLEDFTFEMVIRLNAVGAIQYLLDFRPNATQGAAYPSLYIGSDNKLYYYTNSAIRITGTTTLTTGVNYHVALTRQSGSVKLWLGVLGGSSAQEGASYADATFYQPASASRPLLFANGNAAGTNLFNGWASDIRLTIGTARYAGTFTVPGAHLKTVSGYVEGTDELPIEGKTVFAVNRTLNNLCLSSNFDSSNPDGSYLLRIPDMGDCCVIMLGEAVLNENALIFDRVTPV